MSIPLFAISQSKTHLAWATKIQFVTLVQKNKFSIETRFGLYSSKISLISSWIWSNLQSNQSFLEVFITQKSTSSKSQFLISIIQKPMVSSHGSIPKILIKNALFVLSIFFLSSCVNSPTLDERIVLETKQYISFTWTISSQTWSIWAYKCQNLNQKNYNCFSKKEDLSYLKWEEFFISWILENWKLEVTKKIIIEKEITKEPFHYENNSWWYWFFANTDKFTVVKWWSKTLIKNWSWEVLMQIFSYLNDKIPQDAFISNWWNSVTINWIEWEVKTLNKGYTLWLKNRENWYLVNIIINIWEDEWDNSLVVKSVLDTFKFVDRDKKSLKIKCWWEENTLCPSWYFCELTSDTWNNWKCIMIWE